MIYLKIAEYIQDEFSELKIGKTLFVNQAPKDSSFLVLIRDNPGGIKIDGELQTERKGTFQIIVRGSDTEYEKIYELASNLSSYLSLSGLTLEPYEVKSLRPLHEPLSYQLSEANLFEISVNFSIFYGIVQ